MRYGLPESIITISYSHLVNRVYFCFPWRKECTCHHFWPVKWERNDISGKEKPFSPNLIFPWLGNWWQMEHLDCGATLSIRRTRPRGRQKAHEITGECVSNGGTAYCEVSSAHCGFKMLSSCMKITTQDINKIWN